MLSRSILVIGTGRSGTSAMAGVLHHLGVNMGAEFVEADDTNRFGTFEDLELFTMVRDVLEARETLGALTGLVAEQRLNQALWGWKDPALVHVLPDLMDMLYDARIIVMHRPKAEVLASYRDSYGTSEEKALKAWNEIAGALDDLNVGSTPVLDIEFHDLLDNPREVIGQVVRFALDGMPPPSPEQVQNAIDHIQPDGAPHREGVDRPAFKPLVGIPLERAISHADVVFPWIVKIAQQGWSFVMLGYDRTDVTRNRFAMHLERAPEFTHLVMLDLDHEHPANIVQHFGRTIMDNPDRDLRVLSGLTFRRGKPFEPLAFVKKSDNYYYQITDFEPGVTLEVEAIGTGACCIAREVFDLIEFPYFTYDYVEAHVDKWITEDITFSEKCAAAGIKMWVDTRICSPHLGTSKVDESVFRQYRKQFGANPEEETIVPEALKTGG